MKLVIALNALLVGLTAVLAVPVFDTSIPYLGAKVYRIATGENTDAIASLVEKYNAETWTTRFKANSHVDVQVSKKNAGIFFTEAEHLRLSQNISQPIIVMHEDLGASIAAESASMKQAGEISALAGLATNAWFNAYHTYADHLTFLSDLVATFPSNSAIVTSGTSVGGRTITGIHIWGSGGSGSKPAIVFHGTVHAREWISTMTVEYLAYNLLNNYANDTAVAAAVDKYDYYIFPVVNPDGFVFTQSTTRLWRKNRQTLSSSTCIGRDINRNWNIQWSTTGGASTNPCAEDYKGAAAADAPETQGLQAFLTARRNSSAGLKMFIDWHSYSQLFMSPYGYSCTKVATDRTEHNRLTAGFATALRAVYGTSYTTGPICTTIYAATGNSVDYAYDVTGAKYAFAAELRDTGSSGFVLPAAQIRPSGVETWAGVKYLLANIV